MPSALLALLLALSPSPEARAKPARGPAGKASQPASQEAAKPKGPAFGARPYGLLLIGPGTGADWQELVKSAREALQKEQTPFEVVQGSLDPKLLQRAVDRLQAARISKLVVEAVFLDSRCEELDQLRYLLGIEQYPSTAYLERWGIDAPDTAPPYGASPTRERMMTNAGVKEPGAVQRVKAKVPIVLVGGGLDAAKPVSETLLVRAKTLSRDPKGEAVVLLGEGHADRERSVQRQKTLDALARELQRGGGFRSARGLLMPPDDDAARPGPKEDYPRSTLKGRLWAKSNRVWQEHGPEEQLRDAIRALSVERKVLVLPFLLERDGTERLWRKSLDNLFFQWKGEGLLPSKQITAWVLKQAAEGARLPGMVRFKDQGRTLPPPGKGKGRK